MGKIVWLASYPKSGNTWLRAFLHNYISRAATPHSINRLTEFSASECAVAFFRKYDARPAPQFTTEDVQRMRPLVHKDLTALHDDLVFIKTHNAALKVHDIALCTPAFTAGAVVVVRDPRDIAISYSRFTGMNLDETIAFMGNAGAANRGTETQVFEFLGSWSAHVDSWVKSPNRLVLRYEDMVDAPAKAFGKVIHFLGGEPEPERLESAIAFSSFETLSQQEASSGYAASGAKAGTPFFRVGRAGQWRSTLSAAQVQQIEAAHGTVMRRLGYLA